MEVKDIKKDTYFSGYFYYEVDRYFKYENDCFVLYADGMFNYTDVITQPCYDYKGNYLGVYKTEERYTKKETEKLLESKFFPSVIQINYNFYKIQYGATTMDEVSEFESILQKSKLIKYNVWDSNCRFDKYDIINQFQSGIIKNNSHEPFELIEICYDGNSQRIINNVNKKIYDLDIKEYTKRKNTFIENNPELKERTESIYEHNIVYLMDFWRLNKNQLNKVDVFNKTINKLNRKITNKTR